MNGASRATILAAIRRAQRERRDNETGDIGQRLGEHPRGPLPRLDAALHELLCARLAAASCSVAEAGSGIELNDRLAQWLEAAGIEALVRGQGALLDDVTWPAGCVAHPAASASSDAASVVEAFCAVAETGSVVMLSQPGSPATLNFLPDHFLAIVRRERIVRHIEDVWDLLRKESAGMPRAVNFITGPSRTADVEQTIQLGAHGPRQMHVIICEI